MTPQVNSFDIRKFSDRPNERGKWTHYPQRSEISINFVVNNDKVSTSIIWRTQTLKRFTFDATCYPTISIFAKFPSVGYKQCDYKGNVLHRFQISFHSQEIYDEFCMFLNVNLNLQVQSPHDSRLDSLASQSFNESQLQFYPSQIDLNPATQSIDYNLSQTSPLVQSKIPHYSFSHNSISPGQPRLGASNSQLFYSEKAYMLLPVISNTQPIESSRYESYLNDTSLHDLQHLKTIPEAASQNNYWKKCQTSKRQSGELEYPLLRQSKIQKVDNNQEFSSNLVKFNYSSSQEQHFPIQSTYIPDYKFSSHQQIQLQTPETKNKSTQKLSNAIQLITKLNYLRVEELKDREIKALVIHYLKEDLFVDLVKKVDNVLQGSTTEM